MFLPNLKSNDTHTDTESPTQAGVDTSTFQPDFRNRLIDFLTNSTHILLQDYTYTLSQFKQEWQKHMIQNESQKYRENWASFTETVLASLLENTDPQWRTATNEIAEQTTMHVQKFAEAVCHNILNHDGSLSFRTAVRAYKTRPEDVWYIVYTALHAPELWNAFLLSAIHKGYITLEGIHDTDIADKENIQHYIQLMQTISSRIYNQKYPNPQRMDADTIEEYRTEYKNLHYRLQYLMYKYAVSRVSHE